MLNNARSHNPDPDDLQNTSEGPRGFIFGASRAAKGDLPEDTSVTENPNEEGFASVSSTVGGSFSVLSFEDIHKDDGLRPTKNGGGGPRGRVTGFSGASRLRLLRLLAGVDYSAFEKIYSLGLTYPDRCPDVFTCKGNLKAFRKRMTRRFGEFPAFWRLGVQRRGFWHFHLLVLAPSSFGPLQELRQFIASAWFEACGRISEGHLLAGTNVKEVRSPRRADYAGRYLAKKEKFPEGAQIGKVWGYWNKKLLPIRWETTAVGEEDAYKIRRVFRRLQGKKGSRPLRKVQVFVRYENIAKLLNFLKDDNEWPKGARRPLPPRRLGPHKSSGSRRNEEN
jgi:hypothetical protein